MMNRFLFILIFITFSAGSASAQLLKTSLEITIRDRLGNPVEGAEVQIFRTYEDYQEETNPVSEVQITDSKGRVLFKNLAARPYYVNAEKGDINNYGEGEMVDTLIENRKNKVTIIIQ